jgi:hypothetical protein
MKIEGESGRWGGWGAKKTLTGSDKAIKLRKRYGSM